jgi:hypothetical protein
MQLANRPLPPIVALGQHLQVHDRVYRMNLIALVKNLNHKEP